MARWWIFPLLAGSLVSSLCATHYHLNRFDNDLQGKDIAITAHIVNVPITVGEVTRLDVYVNSGADGVKSRKVRLRWYDAPELNVGETWNLTVRLRQPHGFASPGAFDYQAWMLRQGIQASGYVKYGTLLSNDVKWKYCIHQIRQILKKWLYSAVSNENRGVFLALLLGDSSDINPDQWTVFNATGTTHLMVISGLHIGFMAWLGFSLAAILGRLGFVPLRILPLPLVKAVTGLLFATGYALLSGFSIPVQRALVMTFAALMSPLFGIRTSPVTLWLLALAAVLIIDPLAMTSQGFWYSFIAVAGLIFGMVGRQQKVLWLIKMLKPQWVVFILLTPLLLSNGQSVSPLSPLINLMAIPLVGIVVVPLLLLTSFLQFLFPTLSGLLISWLDYILSGFQHGLLWASQLIVYIPQQKSLSLLTVILAMIGASLLISPSALRLRCLALVMLLPAFFSKQLVIPKGHAEISVLDVGQGLSVLIRTQQYVLIYDTGDRFSEKMSAAQSVILPALNKSGVTHIDRIMISHGDQDHSGGLQPLLSLYPNTSISSGTELPDFEYQRMQCHPGDAWEWDNVFFQVLSGGGYKRRNDSSCVLKVTAGSDSLLLSGDISSLVEKQLVAQGVELKSNILVAAHHGSRFSTSVEFLDVVQPGAVIFSTGFANRFGHPSPVTEERVKQSGAETFNTAVDGSLSFTLGTGNPEISAYRKTHSRYWW